MLIRVLVLLFAASQVIAADDPQKTIEALQVALAQSQQQTAQANQIQLQMAVETAALRKEIEALKKQLSEAQKPKEPAK